LDHCSARSAGEGRLTRSGFDRRGAWREHGRMRDMTFTVAAEPRPRGGITIVLPVDPDTHWVPKERHYVAGTIGGYRMRGVVTHEGDRWILPLGPSWCRDPRVGPGQVVDVVLQPEGPQLVELADDIATAISADTAARRFFESLATFYRKGFIDWIDAAKRPDTRARRIADTVRALQEGRREP
jgi:hypothetical protein